MQFPFAFIVLSSSFISSFLVSTRVATRTKLRTVVYDPGDEPVDYIPSSSNVYNPGELSWPGLDDIDEEEEFVCKNINGAVTETIDDCELVEEEDIKQFVEKYNHQWIRYYENFNGEDVVI